MADRSFSVRIAWDSETRSPEWELQTEHPGFANWLAAALFANQAISPSPIGLHLQKGRLILTLDNGQTLALVGDGAVRLTERTHRQIAAGGTDPRTAPGCAGVAVSAWQLAVESSSEAMIVGCESYRCLDDARPSDLSHLGLDGSWTPSSFEVMGPDGHVPVTLRFDETGSFLDVTVEVVGDHDEVEEKSSIAIATRS
jgi:hypothetical protein